MPAQTLAMFIRILIGIFVSAAAIVPQAIHAKESANKHTNQVNNSQKIVISSDSIITNDEVSNADDKLIPANTLDTHHKSHPDEKNISRNAFGISFSKFNPAPWAPYTASEGFGGWQYNNCNSFYLCTGEGFYGGLITVSYVRRLLASNRHFLDLDTMASAGWQSPEVKKSISKKSSYVKTFDGGNPEAVAMLSLIPTYRLKVLNWMSLGLGMGLNYAIGGLPADIYGQNFNMEAKIELAFQPLDNKEIEFTFTTHHRCAFFGTLSANDANGNTGSNWYAFGVRKWF